MNATNMSLSLFFYIFGFPPIFVRIFVMEKNGQVKVGCKNTSNGLAVNMETSPKFIMLQTGSFFSKSLVKQFSE